MQHTERYAITAQISEFSIPPFRDGLVLGRSAPIGHQALRRALRLLVANDVEDVALEDDVVSHIFVRAAIVRRIPMDTLKDFVLRRIKPLMGAEEILHLELHAEVTLEENNL